MQDELAQELGLSRVPLREAIRRLEGERLVVVNPRRGATVSELTDEDLADLYRVRLALEPMAFARATEAASDAEISRLCDQVEQLAGFVDDPDTFFQMHDDIVRQSIALAPGTVLADIVTTVRERSQNLRYAYSHMPDETQRLLERRRKVLAAMVKRDVELVEQLARLHLIEGRDALLEWRAEQHTNEADQ
jgi:DNA-binding GntR family transcriptional regulator